jgi:putative Holliday junction resolvase
VGRILAVDLGEKRVGIAISDPTRTIARPLTTLARRVGKRAPVQAILDLCREHEVTGIVVGLPLALSGEDTDWTREVRAFAARLAERAGLPVHLLDERFSSVVAERAVRSIGLKRTAREERERVDAGAAAVILQAFLDGQRTPETDS